jgi:hypothetical protein
MAPMANTLFERERDDPYFRELVLVSEKGGQCKGCACIDIL